MNACATCHDFQMLCINRKVETLGTVSVSINCIISHEKMQWLKMITIYQLIIQWVINLSCIQLGVSSINFGQIHSGVYSELGLIASLSSLRYLLVSWLLVAFFLHDLSSTSRLVQAWIQGSLRVPDIAKEQTLSKPLLTPNLLLSHG